MIIRIELRERKKRSKIMTGKAIAYFFLGFVAGLIVVESQKDRPFAPVRFHDGKALESRI